MDDVAEGVLAFIRWTETHPLSPDVPTRAVVAAIRERLDADAPGWRGLAFGADEGPDAVEVELHLGSGRASLFTLRPRPQ